MLFLYWVRTPIYSINIIKEAVQKHDVATFERHVDMDTLYTKAFDDFLVATDKIEGKNSLNNPLAIGFSQMLKGLTCAVVGEMREDTSLIGFVKAELN